MSNCYNQIFYPTYFNILLSSICFFIEIICILNCSANLTIKLSDIELIHD